MIACETEFDAGHRVPGTDCDSPHGHRYRVRVACDDMALDELDVLLGERVRDVLDHGFIVHQDDLYMRQSLWVGCRDWKVIVLHDVPTAVNLAHWACRQLGEQCDGLRRVEVWETPTRMAVVEP